MLTEISVLVVYNQPDPLRTLWVALQGPGASLRQARTCAEAGRILSGAKPPELVFTGLEFPDGNWPDIVRLAKGAAEPVNVIVVSRQVDIPLYIRAIEQGAFDYITPPFEPADLAYVIRCAASNVLLRREVEARARASGQKSLVALALPASR
jgi:two-component system response regulator PilR (NtrC family)